VYDAITAKLATAAGFDGLYVTCAGVTNSLTALPDIGVLGLDEMARQAHYICEATPLPCLCDGDTGYGEVHNVMRTVREFEGACLAGLHIEDQVAPKRCGHLDGKQVIATNAMQQKIAAACEARKDPDFVIMARTDARAVEGVEKAVERAKAYVEAGADAIFPEGLESEAEFAAFRAALDVPLLANLTEFGKTPQMSAEHLARLRYNLVIFPMTAFRVMLKAVGEAYAEIRATGTQAGLLDRMRTRAELYELIGYEDFNRLDRALAERVRRSRLG
jgi:methylisocitrate lyase